MKTGVIWKRIGETPLQALNRFRVLHTIPESIPLTYSGRLDPMAEGKILVLVGDECKAEESYRGLEKQYDVHVLIGVKTDTADVLGIPHVNGNIPLVKDEKRVRAILKGLRGVHAWEYPAYSSKPVNGKPLHQWAQEGRLGEITIPKTNSRIISLSLKRIFVVDASHLRKTVSNRIHALDVGVDTLTRKQFRQDEILAAWMNALHADSARFTVLSLRCIAGSGTYMRTVSEKIGEELGVPACALSITRTKIGRLRTWWFLKFWWPSW